MNDRGRKNTFARAASAVATLVAAVATVGAEAGVTLKTPIDRPDAGHPSGHDFEISRKDCENPSDKFKFNLTLTDFDGKQLEVWMAEATSLDCTLQADRGQTADPHCVKVTTRDPAATLTVELTSAEIAASIESVSGCVDSNSNSAARAFTLYFLLVDATPSDVVDNSATWVSKIDMIGPTPPTELSAGLGDGLLVVSYTAPTSTDVDGFTVYCDPPGGSATSTTSSSSASSSSASSTSTASTGVTTSGAGGGASGSCSSSLLIAGEIPATTLASCGTASKSASKANAKGLTNGEPYAVGIASHDVLGNVGPMSEIVCGVPAPVDDFFETYRDAGGKGGGGCSVSPGGVAGGAGLLAVGLAGLALSARRARRSKR